MSRAVYRIQGNLKFSVTFLNLIYNTRLPKIATPLQKLSLCKGIFREIFHLLNTTLTSPCDHILALDFSASRWAIRWLYSAVASRRDRHLTVANSLI